MVDMFRGIINLLCININCAIERNKSKPESPFIIILNLALIIKNQGLRFIFKPASQITALGIFTSNKNKYSF
jgi:hypothetical protein